MQREADICFSILTNSLGELGEFFIYTVPGAKPLSHHLGHTLPPNLVPNSHLSFERARRWLKACTQEHIRCQAFNTPYMPTRILEISKDNNIAVRLVTNPPAAPYTTLSYCWGGDQAAKATIDCLPAYESNIPVDSLPKTIREALIVTQGIGLRYLWVDALCIIQDSEEDKSLQISQMHRIYRGSHFTIATTVANTSADGFLHPRTSYRGTILRARFDDNVFGHILITPNQAAPISADVPDHRLFTRGWTFQENQLSTRIIAYTDREMVYQCLESRHRDGGDDLSIAFDSSRSFGRFFPDNTIRRVLSYLDPGNRSFAGYRHPLAWFRATEVYTSRELTVPGDKLPALAAIAEEYRLVQGPQAGTYLGGLWKEDFLLQCLWTVTAAAREVRRPAEYRAPSWSWASVDGSVGWVDATQFSHQRMDYEVTARLAAVGTTLYSEQEDLGRVTGGFARISARMRQIVWRNLDPSAMYGSHEGRACEDPGEERKDGTAADRRLHLSMDMRSEWPSESEVLLWCAEVCKMRKAPESRDARVRGGGLLLEEVQQQDEAGRTGRTFRRVGIVSFRGNPYWFDDGRSERREINII
ncbi:heterokaryon incompatibility protein-domain-containing protein [Immersiella caudata]|uniref:Heterokaryon incompatibility protein-domain-containing protein n=1 Tax=Immersiella caudata TaxID=314043 RepID=A0AA39XCB5_9PEZI|nr:heterokaryon incompatibility protein-domain-containing protein [Immersiella caudata]